MADTIKILLLIFSAFSAVSLTVAQGAGRFSVIYAPKFVRFLETSDAIETSDIPGVVAATLGLPLSQDLKWNGLAEGSLFRRPKASVVLSVLDSAYTPLKLNHFQRSYATVETDGALDTDLIVDTIEKEKWKQEPLNVDFYVDSGVFTVRSSHSDLFHRLPSTVYGLLELLRSPEGGSADWFTAVRRGSLNLTEDADLLLVGELYGIAEIIDSLKSDKAVSALKSPDFLHFSVSGLRAVASAHSRDSAQVSDANKLMAAFIDKLSSDLHELYNGNAVLQVVQFSPSSVSSSGQDLLRTGRTLLATDSTNDTSLNLAPAFTVLYAPMFNIILWFMIVFALTVFGIAWGIWNMDPGRDSLIYRMTSQRMKRE